MKPPLLKPHPLHDAPVPVNPSIEEAPIPQKLIAQGENSQELAKEAAQTKEKTPKPAKRSRKPSKGESLAQVEYPPSQPTTPLAPTMTPEDLQQEVEQRLEEITGRATRQTRSLSQGLLELFEGSTMQYHLRNVFNDKEVGCRDAFTKERGWDIFHSFYGNRDNSIPVCNPWTLNFGKLVVTNVIVEPMLISELVKAYDVPSWMVRTIEGYVLLDISSRSIIQCFDLDKTALTIINKDILKRNYENKKDRYRKDIVPHFMRKLYKYSWNYVLPSKREPFRFDYFESYFVKTYYALG